MCLEHLILQFSRSEELHWGNVLSGKHLPSSSTQTACNIGFKLFQQTAAKRRACICRNNESFIFCCNISTNFKSVFWMKTIKKADYSTYTWKEENCGNPFVCDLVRCISVRKNYWKLQFWWRRSSKSTKKDFGPTLVLLWPRFSQYSDSTNRQIIYI